LRPKYVNELFRAKKDHQNELANQSEFSSHVIKITSRTRSALRPCRRVLQGKLDEGTDQWQRVISDTFRVQRLNTSCVGAPFDTRMCRFFVHICVPFVHSPS